MAWSIECLVNTVNIPSKCMDELFKRYNNDGEVEVLIVNGKLSFNSDHMEHMDYLGSHDNVIAILKRYEVEGDICFGSLEGDNAGEFWGYRFDGQSGMKYLKGKLVWEEKKEVLKDKTIVITGSISGLTRKEVEKVIRDAGGRISNTVSKKTYLIVVGDNPGSKLQKARGLGVQVISGDQLLAMVR